MVVDTSVDELARLLTQGVREELEAKLREKFELLMDGLMHELIAPVVSKLARDLAHQTATQIKVWHSHTNDTFQPEIRVQLVFNNTTVGYVQPEPNEYLTVLQPDGSVKLVKKQ